MAIIPLYKEMYQSIKKKIEDELYKKGTLLPTEEQLRMEYNASRTTVRRAIALLQEEGLIKVQQGYGTEVIRSRTAQPLDDISSVSQSLCRSGYAVGVQNMCMKRILADSILAAELQIAPGEPVILIRRIQTADGIPITIAKNYIPEKLVPDLAEEKECIISLYQYLKAHYGIRITKISDRLSACNASAKEAEELMVEPKSALIIVRRVCYQDSVPFEVDYVKIVASKYEYKNEFEER